MRYRILLFPHIAEDLKKHLFSDRNEEQMAITLCGINTYRTPGEDQEVDLLARRLILLPSDAFHHQSGSYLEIKPEVHRHILSMASQEGLVQVDWHTHLGNGSSVGFSGIDDHHEEELACYLKRKLDHNLLGSVVMNDASVNARVWYSGEEEPTPHPVAGIRFGDFDDVIPPSSRGNSDTEEELPDEECYSRQVLAFGDAFQGRIARMRIGLVGLGGLGCIIAEELTRLGVRDWVLVDDDRVETTNLNRLLGATHWDANRGTPKVVVAQRNIYRASPKTKVCSIQDTVLSSRAQGALKHCDLIVLATDNHSSRLVVNRLAVQYLIPLVHVGVNLDVDEEGNLTDISGECVLPEMGRWCLQCSTVIDSQMAGWELAPHEQREHLFQRGYLRDTPSPAVYHLNAVMASLAVTEIHNMIYPYKPLRRYLVYDELKGELMSLEVSQRGDCPACSSQGIIGLGDLEPLPDYLVSPDRGIHSFPPTGEVGPEDVTLGAPAAASG